MLQVRASAGSTTTTSVRDERLLRAAAGKILAGARTILKAREKELRAEASALRATVAAQRAAASQASHGTQAGGDRELGTGSNSSPDPPHPPEASPCCGCLRKCAMATGGGHALFAGRAFLMQATWICSGVRRNTTPAIHASTNPLVMACLGMT